MVQDVKTDGKSCKGNHSTQCRSLFDLKLYTITTSSKNSSDHSLHSLIAIGLRRIFSPSSFKQSTVSPARFFWRSLENQCLTWLKDRWMITAIRQIHGSFGYWVISKYTIRSTRSCCSFTGEFSTVFMRSARAMTSFL